MAADHSITTILIISSVASHIWSLIKTLLFDERAPVFFFARSDDGLTIFILFIFLRELRGAIRRDFSRLLSLKPGGCRRFICSRGPGSIESRRRSQKSC